MTVLAIVGATLIDGTGADPVRDAVVLLDGSRIAAVGPGIEVPADAHRIDASGRYLLPGFVDTNIHLAPFYSFEELLYYHDRFEDIAIEAGQQMLAAGVTTLRDSYGFLTPLLAARDAFARGDVVGPRLLVAGNIVGWGGLGSATVDLRGPSYLSPYDEEQRIAFRSSYALERFQDDMSQGVGEELIDMSPAELRVALVAYLDKGVDFVKLGITTHNLTPAHILFSQRAQDAMVEEIHARGRRADVHATSPEGLRMALLAGIDVIQHPEINDRPLSDELLELIARSGAVCSMNVNFWTGDVWEEYISELAEVERTERIPKRPPTGLERRLRGYRRAVSWWRDNAIRLIEAGCTVSTASDGLTLPPPAIARGTEPYTTTFYHAPGSQTMDSIEGLVEVGMTPMEALVAATRNGALASGHLDEYGTVEAGKSADLVLLDGDPLDDIRNVRRVSTVIARGEIVDRAALPSVRVYSAPPG
jgi:imidazolonepropionase-like amidohydrolase